jgi:hypothetical protein
MVVLGSGVNRAAIYDRAGTTRLLDLPATTQIAWGRILNDISTAGVTAPVPSGGAGRAACCGDFGKVHTWAHSLVMFRDRQRVWEGPIVRVTQRRDNMELLAWDVLGWTRKRRIHTNRVIESSPVVTEALLSATRAFGGDNPNISGYIQNPVPANVGRNVKREVLVDSAYYWDDLSALTDMGCRVTTIGRRILVFSSGAKIGQTALLLPDNHLIADVEVIEDGEALATAVAARDDKAHSAYIGGVDSFYGLVETVLSQGAGASTVAALTNQATAEREDHFPAPVWLNIPDDARLRPDAPFPVEHLVPGTLVPVQSAATCADVKATFTLTGLQVKQDADGVEEVGITLQPVSSQVVAT